LPFLPQILKEFPDARQFAAPCYTFIVALRSDIFTCGKRPFIRTNAITTSHGEFGTSIMEPE
jgi:hypothetical protein